MTTEQKEKEYQQEIDKLSEIFHLERVKLEADYPQGGETYESKFWYLKEHFINIMKNLRTEYGIQYNDGDE